MGVQCFAEHRDIKSLLCIMVYVGRCTEIRNFIIYYLVVLFEEFCASTLHAFVVVILFQ